MRKILLVPERYGSQSGGVAVSATRIAQGLARRGWPLSVLQVTQDVAPGRLESHYRDGVTLFRLGRAPEEDETCQLIEGLVGTLLEQGRAEVVVGFFAGTWAMAAIHGARGRPSLLCLRGNDLDRGVYRPKVAALLDRSLRLARRVACVTREQVEKLRAWFGLEGVYIPNSVDGQQFGPGLETPAGEILVCGEMRLKKGLDLILQVAEEWPEGPAIRLQGGLRGADKERLEDWRRAHPQASGKVLLADYLKDRGRLVKLYQEAALVWHPALWEGMPNAVLEAMACAKVVLTHRVGGCRDLIDDGRTGFLLGLHELQESSSRLKHILALPPSEAASIGRAARHHVLAHHSLDQELDGYCGLLQEVC